MRIIILALLVCAAAFGQCGSAGRLVVNAVTGLLDCTAVVGAGTGSVTSLTATSPIVITPSPTTTTGVISCPSCSALSVAGSQYSVQVNNGSGGLGGDTGFAYNTSTGEALLNGKLVLGDASFAALTNSDAMSITHAVALLAPTNNSEAMNIYQAEDFTNTQAITALRGADIVAEADGSHVSNIFAVDGDAEHYGSNILDQLWGVRGFAANNGAGGALEAAAVQGLIYNFTGGGTIVLASALRATHNGGGGPITTAIGLLVDDMALTGVTNAFAIKTGSGGVVLGDLATTGAATGKTAVCADTAGRLYRSSASGSCAN